MSKHRLVNGRLQQMDKRFSDLKERQKCKIAEWIYDAYQREYRQTDQPPGRKAEERILESVMGQIDDAGIWIPEDEIVQYYRRKKKKMEKRLNAEKIE